MARLSLSEISRYVFTDPTGITIKTPYIYVIARVRPGSFAPSAPVSTLVEAQLGDMRVEATTYVYNRQNTYLRIFGLNVEVTAEVTPLDEPYNLEYVGTVKNIRVFQGGGAGGFSFTHDFALEVGDYYIATDVDAAVLDVLDYSKREVFQASMSNKYSVTANTRHVGHLHYYPQRILPLR